MTERNPKGTSQDPSLLSGNLQNPTEVIDIKGGGVEKIDGLSSIGSMSEIGLPDTDKAIRIARIVLPGGQEMELIAQLGTDEEPEVYFLAGLMPKTNPATGEITYTSPKLFPIGPSTRVGREKGLLLHDEVTPAQIDVDLAQLDVRGVKKMVSREQMQIDVTPTGVTVKNLTKPGNPPLLVKRAKNDLDVQLADPAEADTVPRPEATSLNTTGEQLSDEKVEELSAVGAEVVELSDVVSPPDLEEVVGASQAKELVSKASSLIDAQIDEIGNGEGVVVTGRLFDKEKVDPTDKSEQIADFNDKVRAFIENSRIAESDIRVVLSDIGQDIVTFRLQLDEAIEGRNRTESFDSMLLHIGNLVEASRYIDDNLRGNDSLDRSLDEIKKVSHDWHIVRKSLIDAVALIKDKLHTGPRSSQVIDIKGAAELALSKDRDEEGDAELAFKFDCNDFVTFLNSNQSILDSFGLNLDSVQIEHRISGIKDALHNKDRVRADVLIRSLKSDIQGFMEIAQSADYNAKRLSEKSQAIAEHIYTYSSNMRKSS